MYFTIFGALFLIALGMAYYASNLIATQHILMGSRHVAPFLRDRILGLYHTKRREHYTDQKSHST